MSHQAPEWLNFYEAAWGARHQQMNQLIEKGCTDAYALVEKLRRFDSRYRIGLNLQTQQTEVVPMTYGTDVDLLPTQRPSTRASSFFEDLIEMPTYTHQVDFILDLLDQESFDVIMELGAGFGQNLIEIFYRGGPRVPYMACEYTEAGRQMARDLAARASEMKLDVYAFDHKEPQVPKLPHGAKAFIFTCHSIEQVAQIPQNYFKTLAEAASEVVGLHFEPFGFQIPEAMSPRGNLSLGQTRFFQTQGWNQNFLNCLLGAHERGEIQIQAIHKNIIPGVDPSCPSSLALWRSSTKVL